jgi:hypothetical protein
MAMVADAEVKVAVGGGGEEEEEVGEMGSGARCSGDATMPGMCTRRRATAPLVVGQRGIGKASVDSSATLLHPFSRRKLP